MNELFALVQKMGVPPAAMMGTTPIRFRDILQLLLLSAAIKIVNRAYDILSRLGMIPSLPMQNQAPMLGCYPYPQQPMMGYPAQPIQQQMPQIIPYPDNTKGV